MKPGKNQQVPSPSNYYGCEAENFWIIAKIVQRQMQQLVTIFEMSA